MANDDKTKAVVANEKQKPAPKADKVQGDFPLALNEFCARLSATDKRVELIGGFHLHCRTKGLNGARESEFRREFGAFAGLPA